MNFTKYQQKMWLTVPKPFTIAAYDTKMRCWYLPVYPQKKMFRTSTMRNILLKI